MKDMNEKNYFYELLIKAYEGQISPAETKILNEYIQSDDEAAYLYAEFFDTVSGLVEGNEGVFSFDGNDSTKLDVWLNCLAHDEEEAPAVEITAPREPEILVQKVQHQEVVRKISKGSLFTLFSAAAAIFLIFVFARFVPPQTGIKIAVLADSINAKWADMNYHMEKGTPIATGTESLLLREGYAEILFDNQTRVTLEGPAEFQILADDRIGLNYGKVYLAVSKEAIGFSVYTSNTKIIDMGTEFGVQSDLNGNTQLHVLKGKTMLMAGASDKIHLEVGEGTAKKVSGVTGEISDVRCQSDYFVRAINSESNCIWRGQSKINLADIVGGGNGFGTGKINMTIDPTSGKPSIETPGRRESANDYHPVPSNSYIDGVFIPNGRTRQIVSSQGHLFQECPVTSGLCCYNISYEQRTLDLRATQNSTASVSSPAVLTLLIHANMGITFDLQAIRNLLPGTNIVRFQSRFGIRKWNPRPSASNADFWILVDGKLRYKKEQVKTGELYSIDIEISENDRFLTLIETDGGDPEGRIVDGLVIPPIDSDWGMFADPILVLE